MKLFHSQFTRSHRARWILEEAELAHEVIRVSLREGHTRTAEYLAIHPHGSVPALIDGDLVINESSAILLHIADKLPEKHLSPPLGTPERGRYYYWLVYVPATVDPVLETITIQTRFLPEEKRNADILAEAKRKLATITRVLEPAVEGRSYVVGHSFTAADIAVGSALGWMGFLGLLEQHPKLESYLKGLQARPAYARAHAD